AAGAPKKIERRRLREFGLRANAAIDAVDLGQEPLDHPVDEGEIHRRARLWRAELIEAFAQRGDILRDLIALAAISLGDRLQHLRQAGPAPARRRREIGAAPER